MKNIFYLSFVSGLLLVLLGACNVPGNQQTVQEVPSRPETEATPAEQTPETAPNLPESSVPPGIAEIIPYEVGGPIDLSPKAQLDYQAEWEHFNNISDAMSKGGSFESLSAEDQEFVRNFDETRPQTIFYTGTMGDSWYDMGGPYKLSASSVLAPAPPNSYYPDNAHDFDLSTAWVEGNDGDGIGESLSFYFKANSPPVTEVHLYNGYVKTPQAWQNNNRVKTLKVWVDEVAVALLKLEDTSGIQKFQLGQEYQSNTEDMVMRFEIREVYKGDKYEDTAIAELEFDGTGVY